MGVSEHSKSFIEYCPKGKWSIEKIEKIPGIIFDQCKRNNMWKVILNTKNVNQYNVSNYHQYKYGDIIANVLAYKVRLGVFGNGELFNHLAETVAKARGVQISLSDDYNVLLEWLNRN